MTDRESLVLCSYYLDNPALRRFHAIIRPEQFQEPGTSMLFTVLQKYHQEYGRMPTHQEAEMEVRDYRGPKQHEEDSALELLGRYEAERAVAAPEPRWLERQVSPGTSCHQSTRQKRLYRAAWYEPNSEPQWPLRSQWAGQKGRVTARSKLGSRGPRSS